MRLSFVTVLGMLVAVIPRAANAQPPGKDALLRAVVASYTARLKAGDSLHWAESGDSVVARFATCTPYKGATACVLKDTIATYSFEITLMTPTAASVVVKRYHMAYETCPLRTPLDPPAITFEWGMGYWNVQKGMWVQSPDGSGRVC